MSTQEIQVEMQPRLSTISFYITPTEITFLVLAVGMIFEEIALHVIFLDQLFFGGLFTCTLYGPSIILIMTRMSQRVGYTENEKRKMSFAKFRESEELDTLFSPRLTAKYTVYSIIGVLGSMEIAGFLAQMALKQGWMYPVEVGFFEINIAIAENLYYQVAPIIGLTCMLLYPRKLAGIPAALAYLFGMVWQSIEPDQDLRILINVIPSIVFVLFFSFAKREITMPSKSFQQAMIVASGVLFFIGHVSVYGKNIIIWIGIFSMGIILAYYYTKTRNIAIMTWAHVLLNILALPALLFGATFLLKLFGA